MKRRPVAASAVKFVVGVDKEFRVFSFEFKDGNSLLHAENTVDSAEGFHAGDRVSLPYNFGLSLLSDLLACWATFEVLDHVVGPAGAAAWVIPEVAYDVLEVVSFSFFDEVLGAAKVDFIAAFAREFIDGHPLAAALVGVGAGPVDFGVAFAVAVFVLEVLGGDTFHQLAAEVALEDLSEVGVLSVRH